MSNIKDILPDRPPTSAEQIVAAAIVSVAGVGFVWVVSKVMIRGIADMRDPDSQSLLGAICALFTIILALAGIVFVLAGVGVLGACVIIWVRWALTAPADDRPDDPDFDEEFP